MTPLDRAIVGGDRTCPFIPAYRKRNSWQVKCAVNPVLTLSIAVLRGLGDDSLDDVRLPELVTALGRQPSETEGVPLRVWWSLESTSYADLFAFLGAAEPAADAKRLAVRVAIAGARQALAFVKSEDQADCMAAILAAEIWAAAPSPETAETARSAGYLARRIADRRAEQARAAAANPNAAGSLAAAAEWAPGAAADVAFAAAYSREEAATFCEDVVHAACALAGAAADTAGNSGWDAYLAQRERSRADLHEGAGSGL